MMVSEPAPSSVATQTGESHQRSIVNAPLHDVILPQLSWVLGATTSAAVGGSLLWRALLSWTPNERRVARPVTKCRHFFPGESRALFGVQPAADRRAGLQLTGSKSGAQPREGLASIAHSFFSSDRET
jgi:hypothetical protein